MNARKISLCCLLLTGCLTGTGSEITVYTSRAAFIAATTGLTNVDLGLGGNSAPSFLLSGFNFLIDGNDTGKIFLASSGFCCAAYNRGATSATGGNSVMLLAPVDTRVTAIGFNAFTVAPGNVAGTNQDVIDVSAGNVVYHFRSAPAPNTVFIGFTSDSPLPFIALTPPAASRQVNVQNVTYGSASHAPTPPAPFGSVDTPLKNATNVSGAIGVTGWALSSNSISNVAVWREAVVGEVGDLLFLGNASIIPGVRPDVAAAYPGYPNNNNGWGLQVLTNQLPGGIAQPPGNGTYKLHVIASYPEGGSADLAGPISITVNNAAAAVPFGTIDTPAQGGIVSGSAYVNFGWALTPNPGNVIPKDGSTITVLIDNQVAGHPVYNNNRSDIASLFPGLQNSNGAIGYYSIDSTKLTNGLHTISWVVSDNVGHSQGIGSRYFFVQN